MTELSVAASARLLPILYQEADRSAVHPITNRSSTDTKTADIAGRILIGAALVLAAVSLYAAFVISATYAWCLPFALISGTIGLKIQSPSAPPSMPPPPAPTPSTSDTDSSFSGSGYVPPSSGGSSGGVVFPVDVPLRCEPFVPGQPVGILNSSCNCCFIAIAQFIRHIPSLYNFVQNSGAELATLRKFYAEYDRARSGSQHVARGANIQTVREWLSLGSNISNLASRQEDAHEGLNLVMRNFPPHYLHLQRRTGVTRDEPSSIFSINIQNHKNRSLATLFQERFLRLADETRNFRCKPTELLFHINRNDSMTSKNCDSLNIDSNLTLPGSCVMTGGGGQYVCDAFIQHLGASMEGGHYVAFINIKGQWWCCNDDEVRKASAEEVDEARRQAYVLHFRAV